MDREPTKDEYRTVNMLKWKQLGLIYLCIKEEDMAERRRDCSFFLHRVHKYAKKKKCGAYAHCACKANEMIWYDMIGKRNSEQNQYPYWKRLKCKRKKTLKMKNMQTAFVILQINLR